MNRWLQLVQEDLKDTDSIEIKLLENSFRQLMDAFIDMLSRDDLRGYYELNRQIAHKIALNDISYRKFLRVFHFFEDSYLPVLIRRYDREAIAEYLTALDNLHHDTIAVISQEYFKVKDTTMLALVKLSELRDKTTGNHLERTMAYMKVLGEELEMDSDYVDELVKAGPLHDIGKVGIPDSILLKPGKLSKEEFEEMKRHAEIGAFTIEQLFGVVNVNRGYLKTARDIALYHHEKFDGTGYPHGLKGNKIPLCARIFALVDSYDAIVSKRPYKDPLSHYEAVRRISEDSGKHFDPEVAAAFLNIHEKFQKIYSEFAAKQNLKQSAC